MVAYGPPDIKLKGTKLKTSMIKSLKKCVSSNDQIR